MKLNQTQLRAQLAKQLGNFYFVSGDEILLSDETRQEIKNAAKKLGFLICESYSIDDSFDFDNFRQQTQQTSLFSNKTIIELRFPNKFSDAAKKFLLTAAEAPLIDKLLIVVTGRLDANQLKTKWLQAIENACCFIQLWPITRDRLPQWIKQRSQQLNLTIESKACELLADFSEGNLLACAQAIEQLKLIHDTKTITFDQVKSTITDQARFDIFYLVDSVISGEQSRAFHILQTLQQEGNEIILIVWALARECRLLMDVSWQISKKQNLDSCLQKAKIWPKRQPLIKKALKRKSYDNWQFYLNEMQNIDREMKGAKKGNPWLALSSLVMLMAS